MKQLRLQKGYKRSKQLEIMQQKMQQIALQLSLPITHLHLMIVLAQPIVTYSVVPTLKLKGQGLPMKQGVQQNLQQPLLLITH